MRRLATVLGSSVLLAFLSSGNGAMAQNNPTRDLLRGGLGLILNKAAQNHAEQAWQALGAEMLNCLQRGMRIDIGYQINSGVTPEPTYRTHIAECRDEIPRVASTHQRIDQLSKRLNAVPAVPAQFPALSAVVAEINELSRRIRSRTLMIDPTLQDRMAALSNEAGRKASRADHLAREEAKAKQQAADAERRRVEQERYETMERERVAKEQREEAERKALEDKIAYLDARRKPWKSGNRKDDGSMFLWRGMAIGDDTEIFMAREKTPLCLQPVPNVVVCKPLEFPTQGLMFISGKFAALEYTFDSKNSQTMFDNLVERYGKPTRQRTGTFQLISGAKFDSLTAVWRTPSGDLTFEQYYEKFDVGRISMNLDALRSVGPKPF